MNNFVFLSLNALSFLYFVPPVFACIVLQYFVLLVDLASSYFTLSLSPLGVLSPTLRERKKHAQFKRQKIDLLLQRQFEIELRR